MPNLHPDAAGRQRFGLWTLIFLVVANMVGAGVFTTSGYTLQSLGTPRLVVLAWIVGGLIALTGAISYGRLVRAMPDSGGEYLFLSRAAHPLWGFLAGWVSLIAGFSGAIAFAATALESYVAPEETRPPWLPRGAIAMGAVMLGGLSHGWRARGGAIFQNITVVLKLALLLGFLALAAWTLFNEPQASAGTNPGDLNITAPPSGPGLWQGGPMPDMPTGVWPLIAAFATSVVWISLSYSGFNAAVYIAGEARNVAKNVPRALLIATIAVMVLYVLLNAVFVYAPPPNVVAGAPDVAAVTAQWLGGDQAALLARGVIALALLTSVSSMVMAAPRVYAKMADDGLFPRWLSFHGDAPGRAVAFQVAFAVGLILISTLRGLLTYLGLTLSLCAAGSVCCLFLPSIREKRLLHLFHLPPAIYVSCTLVAAAIMTVGDPRHIIGTVLTFGAGAVAFLFVRRR